MNPLQVAVIGCGYWAPNVVRNLVSLEDVEVVALCDVRADLAQELARRLAPGATVAADHRELSRDSRIDAVFIVTPVQTHYAVGGDFLRGGKHVFAEKPLAMTAEECADLIRLAEQQQRVLMVGHVFEYNTAVVWIRKYLEGAELGRLLYIYSQRVNLGRIQNDINALWSFAPHDISILNYWLADDPVWVSVRGLRCLGHNVEDTVFVLLEYPNGVGVHLHLGWLDPRKIRQMTLVGSRKMLVYDDVSLDSRIQIYDKGVTNLDTAVAAPESFAEFQYEIRTGNVVIPHIPYSEPLHEECKHFVQCVRTGARPRTDGWNGLRVVRVLQAAQRSLERGGEAVRIADVPVPSHSSP